MGGRAAEIVCYGNEEGLSSGVASDLQHATQLALRMVTDFAMDEEIGHIALQELGGRNGQAGAMSDRVAKAAERIIRQQLERAIATIKEQRDRFDTLVDGLLEKNRLTEPELEAILGS